MGHAGDTIGPSETQERRFEQQIEGTYAQIDSPILLETVQRPARQDGHSLPGTVVTFPSCIAKHLRPPSVFVKWRPVGRPASGICMEKTGTRRRSFWGSCSQMPCWFRFCPDSKTEYPPHHRQLRHGGDDHDSERLNEVSEFAEITKLFIGHGESKRTGPIIRICAAPRARMFLDASAPTMRQSSISFGSTGATKILISHRNHRRWHRYRRRVPGYHAGGAQRPACCRSLRYGLNQIWQTIAKARRCTCMTWLFRTDLFALLAKESITACR